jgi:hypothetical protein
MSTREKVSLAIAVIVLVAFVVLIVYMMRHLEADEKYWTRALYLFGGVEAVAFAAAGYLFGREVSRQQITKAEEQTKEAKKESATAQQDAASARQEVAIAQTKTKDLLAAVRAQAAGGETILQIYDDRGDSAAQSRAVQLALQQLSQMVEEIYHA